MTEPAPCSRSPNSQDDRRVRFVGVDEAGYGPNLGPLVVCSVAFEGPFSLRERCWWECLHPAIGRASEKRALAVDDSKRVLAGASGRRRLEATVESFLNCLGCRSLDIHSLFAAIAPESVSAFQSEHWYAATNGKPVASETPDASNDAVDSLTSVLRSRRLRLCDVRAKVIFPNEFNRLLRIEGNKAAAELSIVRQLLAPHFQTGDVYADVDRLGGRRYYRTALEGLAGSAFLLTSAEGPTQSCYRFNLPDRDAEIRFQVKADATSLPVALASMFAKYLRERCMEMFNRFWMDCVPELRPTAGYPVDARRFLNAVSKELEQRKIPLDEFWRER